MKEKKTTKKFSRLALERATYRGAQEEKNLAVEALWHQGFYEAALWLAKYYGFEDWRPY